MTVVRIVLVGRRKDKRVVRWSSVVCLTLALSLVIGGMSGLLYFALSGSFSFSSEAVLLGIFGSVIVVATRSVQRSDNSNRFAHQHDE